METRNCSKDSGATILVRASQAAGFKACCMKSGNFDGSDRADYFRD
jgi:hypothetical protein